MKHPIPTLLSRLARAALLAAATCTWLHAAAWAHPADPADELSGVDLTELSLEELMDMEVTIASRSVQKLSQVPGAVYVLTGDEIRRAGHTSIQEALRMVPGFYVSNWTTNLWDVTSRGFGTGTALANLAFLNQLLVMVDGVVLYTPLFAGVWWHLNDVDLEDVDRVEIIRGPGGILWGSNAVQGVVHIVTKHSGDTQGLRVDGRFQRDEWHAGSRFGGRMGETGSYRVWYKSSRYQTHDNPFLGFSQDWGIDTVGMRADWGREGERRTTVWGRVYGGSFDADGFDGTTFTVIPVEDVKEGVQLYGSTTSPDGLGTFSSWLYYDRQDLKTELDIDITSFDVEYKREYRTGEHSTLVGGVGYRLVKSHLAGDDPFFEFYEPEDQTLNTFRAFGVETWKFPEQKVDVVLGAAIEHNDFTQFEIQPTLRAIWYPTERFSVWGSLTRSVRTPSLEERSLSANSAFVGSDAFDSERGNTAELGVRTQLGPLASLDVVGFYNQYDDLHFREGGFLITNNGEGESYGLEVAVDAKPSERWSLRSAYTLVAGEYENKLDGGDLGTDDRHPRHQVNLRSYFDLSEHWELDTAAYLVQGLGDAIDIANRWRLDVRLGWRPCDDLRLSIGSQMLNEDTESEFDEFDNLRRQFFIALTWTPGASRPPE